jgi:hypothetical protein
MVDELRRSPRHAPSIQAMRTTSPPCGGNVNAVSFASLPREAAWQHRGARSGFELAFLCDPGRRVPHSGVHDRDRGRHTLGCRVRHSAGQRRGDPQRTDQRPVGRGALLDRAGGRRRGPLAGRRRNRTAAGRLPRCGPGVFSHDQRAARAPARSGGGGAGSNSRRLRPRGRPGCGPARADVPAHSRRGHTPVLRLHRSRL